MKISVSDKFLWDIYNFLEDAGDAFSFIFRSYPTMRNTLPGPQNPVFKKYQKDRSRRNFNRLIYYLKRNGYIKIKNLENKQAIIITKEGISKALKASFKIENGKKRKDGKWVMVIFDVPEKYRKSRSLLRNILHNFGYKMFQQSVWISPYDVLNKTEKLLQIYSLDDYVKIFLIEEF